MVDVVEVVAGGVGLAGLCLGPWRGFASVLLYLLVGAAGLPVFARGGAGLAPFVGPTGGYLIAFPLAALLAGFVATLVLKRGLSASTPVIFFLGLLAGRYLIILPLGVFGLMRAGGMDFGKAFGIDMGFWVSDAIKSVIVVILAYAVHRAFPRLLAQRRSNSPTSTSSSRRFARETRPGACSRGST